MDRAVSENLSKQARSDVEIPRNRFIQRETKRMFAVGMHCHVNYDVSTRAPVRVIHQFNSAFASRCSVAPHVNIHDAHGVTVLL